MKPPGGRRFHILSFVSLLSPSEVSREYSSLPHASHYIVLGRYSRAVHQRESERRLD